MRAIRVLAASGSPAGVCGLNFVGALLGRASRLAPLTVVLIPPEHLLQNRIDDVIRVALNEPSIVFEQIVDRLFEFYFACHDSWCLLNDRHTVPPLAVCGSF